MTKTAADDLLGMVNDNRETPVVDAAAPEVDKPEEDAVAPVVDTAAPEADKPEVDAVAPVVDAAPEVGDAIEQPAVIDWDKATGGKFKSQEEFDTALSAIDTNVSLMDQLVEKMKSQEGVFADDSIKELNSYRKSGGLLDTSMYNKVKSFDLANSTSQADALVLAHIINNPDHAKFSSDLKQKFEKEIAIDEDDEEAHLKRLDREIKVSDAHKVIKAEQEKMSSVGSDDGSGVDEFIQNLKEQTEKSTQAWAAPVKGIADGLLQTGVSYSVKGPSGDAMFSMPIKITEAEAEGVKQSMMSSLIGSNAELTKENLVAARSQALQGVLVNKIPTLLYEAYMKGTTGTKEEMIADRVNPLSTKEAQSKASAKVAKSSEDYAFEKIMGS